MERDKQTWAGRWTVVIQRDKKKAFAMVQAQRAVITSVVARGDGTEIRVEAFGR